MQTQANNACLDCDGNLKYLGEDVLEQLEYLPASFRIVTLCRRWPHRDRNSAAERSLRGITLGRRNYLFAGADSGGKRAAAICGLIRTARLNGIDPETWMRHVLTHIADHYVNRVDDFLPWNYAAKLAG